MSSSKNTAARTDKEATPNPIDEPWALDGEQVLEKLEVSRDKGLDEAEVSKRREQYGRNRLRQKRKTSVWKLIFAQFKSLIVVLLLVGLIH